MGDFSGFGWSRKNSTRNKGQIPLLPLVGAILTLKAIFLTLGKGGKTQS
jgi:hypothetical protein